jgi:hypothetical protein
MKQVNYLNSDLQQLAAEQNRDGHPEQCTYEIYRSTSTYPEPMPHQLVLCKDKAENGGTFNAKYCAKDGYMLVSLYDPIYLAEPETIMANMIGYSNIHAYMQGKYI